MECIDFDVSENFDDDVQAVSPLNQQLRDILLPDLNYVQLLSQLCKKLKLQNDYSFDDSCGLALQLVQNICHLETRFLILREFLETQNECLPISLLWAFETQDLLHFPVYLAKRPEFVAALSQHLTHILFLDCKMNLNVVLSLIGPTFVSICLLDPVLGCPSEEFHSQFQIMCVGRILSNLNHHGTDLIMRLTNEPSVLPKPLLLFIRQTLRHILLHVHFSESLPSVAEAINKQTLCWTFHKIPQHITHFIKQLLDGLLVDNTIHIFNDCLNSENNKVNWKWFLVVISTLVVTSEASAEHLKKTLDQWMKESVVKKCKYRLVAVILAFRQCFAESVPPFISYASWFSSLDVHFETPQEFMFFIDFLSEIVPHEPSIYLKIHINKVPSVPPGAHAALSDYISLAKTRLADLNETTDYIGLFGEYKTTEREGRESDIARVVAHYRDTGEILKTVIEASVFRRTYYERVFLADLLQTESYPEVHKCKLIEKLHAIGKCPNAMYTDWVKRNDIVRQQQKEKMEF